MGGPDSYSISSVASKMTGLLKTKKKKKGKKSKSGSQIALRNVLPPIRNELLWFCRSDQECSGKIPIKANLPQWQNFGQLLDPDSCAIAKCLAGWSGIRKCRIGRLATKSLGKTYWMSTVCCHIWVQC